MHNKVVAAVCSAVVASVLLSPVARAQTPYQKPPKEVLDVLHAPLPPAAFVSPTRDTLLLASVVRYPPVADLAQPMLRLAGTRINPKTNGTHGEPYFSQYLLVKVSDGAQIKVALPPGARPTVPHWSADGKRFAFANLAANGVELWVGEAATGKARRLGNIHLNPVLGDGVKWMPDQRTLLVKLISRTHAAAPPETGAPVGPDVQESNGKTVASSTYEARDVLKNQHDAELFDYYATAQLALVDATSGKTTPIGKPALYTGVSPAPDGKHLLVESVHRPYSYLHSYNRFPQSIEIWNSSGKLVRTVASLPLAENVPIWGVPTGPREFVWRATEPATLLWVEALDGGDWNQKVPHRDRLLKWKAPFEGTATELYKTQDRFAGIEWGERDGLALLEEEDQIRHWSRTLALNVDDPSAPPRVLFDLSSDDRYHSPGFSVMRTLPNGYSVIQQEGENIYFAGQGASPEGDRPFLDSYNLKQLRAERLFRSGKTSYELFVAWLNPSAGEFITRYESPTEHPNYCIRTLGQLAGKVETGEALFASTTRAITHIPDPTPQLRGITKRIVKYKRADGVPLSFTLYLPPNYKEGTRLPTMFWAYPLDYADAKMAGQVTGSTQRFTLMGWPLHLFFLLQGYAIIDNPSLPVVGDTKKIYDTYMEQLVAGAKAAVDKAVEMGVCDPDRIGIMGHSHGGLMTANLLANSELFRAGIARSGAYNHTIRPFGFQSERRTLWEAPDVYLKVSPMIHADKIKKPLLIIHGAADVNPGTVPFQSELLYQAIRGIGGTVRLVMLPFESHGYSALESNEHVLYEMISWFDHYVKNAPPRGRAPSASN
jgi:dipeptidyl aminopeptidase/acylaminoacyl peptidase